ncbi:hypothetical protein BC938DRAFT_475152 [Jimgerdemannia flammicorona]|uniref:Uncharacterized protein n=1 Tax=Jimgerdemannia flammicorona TaxID=994334 RepID=A0A433QS11_9FUNG|nr:hypothetical protein BC938DRAFT_475152 [Jimgerdemannia flammicorona]
MHYCTGLMFRAAERVRVPAPSIPSHYLRQALAWRPVSFDTFLARLPARRWETTSTNIMAKALLPIGVKLHFNFGSYENHLFKPKPKFICRNPSTH